MPGVGVAAYFMTNVFATPSFEGRRMGWLRVGQKVEIGPREEGDERCPEGFYPLTRTRGYVCAGKGIIVGRYPRSLRLGARPPNLEAIVPYSYGYVRQDETPLYRRMPTRAQVVEIEEPEPEPDAGVEPSVPIATDVPAEGDGATATPPQPRQAAPGSADEGAQDEEEEEPDMHGGLVVRYMKKGFMLSIDRPAGEWPNVLYRTIRGQFVNARKVHLLNPTTFEGVALAEGEGLPVAFATGNARARHERTKAGRIAPRGQVGRNHGFWVKSELEERRVRYLEAADGSLFRAAGMTIIRPTPRPEGVGPTEKWIDVDLAHQTLTAYEGDRAVYCTLVSSGSESHDHATPPGSFRIRSKHVTFTMDGDLEGDGAYSIEDVPFVMYYDLSYALHAAFWHSFYGRQRSHGCVNLSGTDARWIFRWVDPQLPDGWYGIWADDEHPGTRVFIRPS